MGSRVLSHRAVRSRGGCPSGRHSCGSDCRQPGSPGPALPRAALSRVLPAVSRGPHPSGSSVVPTLTSPTNPRETWGELTRHVRADDVQAHRDGLVDLGKKEQCVAQPLRGSLRVHSLAPGPSPSPPWALALHPIPPLPAGSPRASPRRSVLWETIPGCYWNVSHNQRPSV